MKTVWSALVAKAERAVREAQLRLADVNRQRENALMQGEKVDALLGDYNQQLHAVQQRDHNSTEVNNYRHFIVQLQEIKNRAKYEMQRLEMECQAARNRLIDAERERMKVDHLATRARDKHAQEAVFLEARTRDAQAIQQHNFRARVSQ